MQYRKKHHLMFCMLNYCWKRVHDTSINSNYKSVVAQTQKQPRRLSNWWFRGALQTSPSASTCSTSQSGSVGPGGYQNSSQQTKRLFPCIQQRSGIFKGILRAQNTKLKREQRQAPFNFRGCRPFAKGKLQWRNSMNYFMALLELHQEV